jgi:hypothetical protein
MDMDEIHELKQQVEELTLSLSVQRALILGLMSELGVTSLQEFSTFRRVTQGELAKYPPQSDDHHEFRRQLNTYLNKAMAEASSDMIL